MYFRLCFSAAKLSVLSISTLDRWCCQFCLLQMSLLLKPQGILPVCMGQEYV